MLRITPTLHIGGAEGGRATWVLKVEGRIRDEWVGELRRCWRTIREAGSAPICLDLADVLFVDDAGKALLKEMHREGVEIRAHGCVAGALCAEIVAAPQSPPRRS